MKAFGLHASSVPERGLLNVYVATAPKFANVIWLMLQAMLGMLQAFDAAFSRDGAAGHSRRHAAKSADHGLNRRRDHSRRPPLVYRIRPTPLRVLMPKVEES